MRLLAACLLIIAVSECTTMRPIDGSPADFQRFINSGELLKRGDRVRIVTADEKTHRFAITKIAGGVILGANECVPVDEVMILAIENPKSVASFPFDTKLVTDWVIALAPTP
jgi:hypothetical protein